MHTHISVRGARAHNLQNVDLDIPRGTLAVITGVSGSGKSSLAFDTIYAEGQRRYVESLSAYARQFLELMAKPDVDSIEGLSPAIAIEQKTTSRNPRSTVATVTEIYDYMRLLWARVGVPHSPVTGDPIATQTVTQMVDRVMAMEAGKRLYVLAPVARGRKGEYRRQLAEFQAQGYSRVKINGNVYELPATPYLDRRKAHDIAVVVDRLVVKDGMAQRVAESLEAALRLADGLAVVEDADTGEETLFSERFACPISGFTIAEISPRLFSFNSPHGACPKCAGLGVVMAFDRDLVVSDRSLTLAQGAVKPWAGPWARYYRQALEAVVRAYGGDMDTPWHQLPAPAQEAILHGSGDRVIPIVYEDSANTYRTRKPFEGVIPSLARRILETESEAAREKISLYQVEKLCTSCKGRRLRPEALAIKVSGRDISSVCDMSITEAQAWFAGLALQGQQAAIAARLLKEITERLTFLANVGLDYLTLSRTAGTLSGGEAQRIRLASQIGSGLTGVLYVLDEPSIGLHQRDNARLLKTLKKLRDLGNTVLVVEHDEDAIRAADFLVDMGPGAGTHGGYVVAAGPPKTVFCCKKSLTARYITGKCSIPMAKRRRKSLKNMEIVLEGATGHNLKNDTLCVPLGIFTCVTGVSGSGKSSLILETLYPSLISNVNKVRYSGLPYSKITGAHLIDKVIDIDQSPIGRTPRSNPATYTGAFAPIRDWFAGLPEAKARGYGPGRFSFNVKGGRCEACKGDGVLKIEMHFLSDIYVECEECRGKRYNRETLAVQWRGKSIADVLGMTIDDAADLFAAVPTIRDKLKTLQRVGLGYMHLGQQATTLSGGEAQRVKLSRELAKRATGRTLYILDEPTTGLHFSDVRKLLEVLHALVDAGNTVIVIEHNLDVIKTADHIIDIGPEGGAGGGRIIATGTPEEVAKAKKSHTGRFLASVL
ncbi:MAG TPA: excinuclease ABC subunit A [Rhodospirillaceae bacterium]|jgi:excinuclease ABC subunit A|nr:excinuclease ABC subunit UvrA [Alphaproteobacteria bacterium]HBH26610.1 excinuclease ABC subunit A [Rhodospirillaceae bacterium]